MRRTNPIYALAAIVAMAIGFLSCNQEDTSDEYVDNSTEYSVVVSAFKLAANDSVLAGLDSVYFSIDLNKALIYNADSLPLGTRVDSLAVTLTANGVSKIEIIMPNPNDANTDTVIDYLENTEALINFSRGSVKMQVTSQNEQNIRVYNVFVNVHKMKPDSLAWGDAAYTAYPTPFSAPTALKAVDYQGKALCFSADGTSVNVAVAENPGEGAWSNTAVTAPAGMVIESIVAGDNILYALDNANALYSSADGGVTWTATGAAMTHIYGVYNDSAVGVNSVEAGKYNFVTYPATTEIAVPENAPVRGTSTPLLFTTEWSTAPMLMVLGGETAEGSPVGTMWSYDGKEWACTTLSGIPGVTGPVIVPYFTYKVTTAWITTKNATLLAFGGKDKDGELSRTVYVSVDRGVHWSVGGELLQLPEAVPSIAGAQGLVFESTLGSRASSEWTSLELPRIPTWFTTSQETGIAPITSWECPYIYLMGGVDASGSLNTAVWRGVLNRLSFKPLQ